MDELEVRRDEAVAYARSHPDERVAELIGWAVFAAQSILLFGEEQRYFLDESLPEGPMDFLLFAQPMDGLARHRDLLRRILSGEPVADTPMPSLDDEPVPRTRNVRRAVAFAQSLEDPRARALVGLAVVSAMRALRGERAFGEVGPPLPVADIDLLLHARLISHLANRHERIRNILAGDFTETNAFDAAMDEDLGNPGRPWRRK